MPCFKGIAVSIHANGAPLPEHGIQKQSRVSRISTYIPVPPPQISAGTNKPEPARFAISITLLTPGLPIPYSTPKPTESNPKPKPEYVGILPGPGGDGTKAHAGGVTPYIPMTNSTNETIAAYIYFDGRAKEEVATLLRPGEETWVNSRWVQVPESEGGGLAEREFLFREVGLERWLNGLDLQGDDAQAKLERRRKRFEKRRRRQKAEAGLPADSQQDINGSGDVLRYGADDGSPVQAVFDDDSDSFSDDDEPPEATGQIKVAMFRVLASGEIKKGEYSPQFDAHDDDDDDVDTTAQETNNNNNSNNLSLDADVEHTTSFAKPKTLDPSTISTQTVTGIDGPDKPYATFTFFYRGERQLQKIGVLASKASQQTPSGSKRRSAQLDFSSLGPLKTGGTVGFSAFRDGGGGDATRRRKARKKINGNVGGALQDDSEDEDDEGEILGKMQDIVEKETGTSLSPEDATFQGELADGVGRMRLKRAHSADPDSAGVKPGTPAATATATLAGAVGTGSRNSHLGAGDQAGRDALALGASSLPSEGTLADSAMIGSPMKKHRPSVSGASKGTGASTPGAEVAGLDVVLSGSKAVAKGKLSVEPAPTATGNEMEEEEL